MSVVVLRSTAPAVDAYSTVASLMSTDVTDSIPGAVDRHWSAYGDVIVGARSDHIYERGDIYIIIL